VTRAGCSEPLRSGVACAATLRRRAHRLPLPRLRAAELLAAAELLRPLAQLLELLQAHQPVLHAAITVEAARRPLAQRLRAQTL